MKTYAKSQTLWTLLASVLLGAGTLLQTSCVGAKDPYSPNNPNEGKMGSMQVGSLGREGDFIVAETTKAAGATIPDVETFRVAVLDREGKVVHNNLTGQDYAWDTFAEVNGQMITIPSGKYRLEAASLAEEPLAAWDTPYYYGIKDFTVKIAELTKVDLVCQLANVKVTVDYQQDFLDKVDKPAVEVYFDYTDPETAKKYKANLGYAVGETRGGYFKVPADGKLYVRVSGIRKEDGQPLGGGEGQVAIISDVKAQQWHKVSIGYQQSGQISSSITVDYTTIDSEHTVTIPDGDGVIDGGSNNDNWEGDGGSGSDLAIVGADFNGKPFDIAQQIDVKASDNNVIDVRFDAPKGIKELYVTINSSALEPMLPSLGLANGQPFDIANPPAEKPEGIDEAMWWVNMFANEDIGILDPNVPIKGKKTHTFKVGGLMTLLASVATQTDVHTFGLKLVDNEGNEAEATLKINLIK